MILNKLDLAEMVSDKEKEEDRRPEDRFSLDRVMEIAWNIATGSQADYGSKETSSPDYYEAERPVRNNKVKFEDEQMENMIANLQDQQKISEKHMLGAIEQLAKTFQQTQQAMLNSQRQSNFAHQVPVPTPMQNYANPGYQNPMSGPRVMNRFRPFNNTHGNCCFYCGEEDCMRDRCPHRAKHIQDGWVIIDDMGRTKLPDGRPIPITGGPTQKARVEALNKSGATSQNLVLTPGRPGVIQLSQSLAPQPVMQTQADIENDLSRFDLNDLVQYISTRSGKGIIVEENNEEGFN